MKKTASFAVVHFSVAFSVGYALTGSIAVGSAVALVEPLVNTVAFYFHERIWERFEGQSDLNQANNSTSDKLRYEFAINHAAMGCKEQVI